MSVRGTVLVAALTVSALAGCASAPPPPADSALSLGVGSRVPLTSAPASEPASTTAPKAVTTATVHGIGDSIMVDSSPNLIKRVPGITIDAVIGRPVGPGLAALQAQHDAGSVADVTVFALGTNGPFTTGELAQVIDLTAGHALVVVTSHCPHCSWTDADNAVVHTSCTRASHCVIADFQALALRNPQWFGGDGVHMTVGGVGADGYARAVAAAVRSAQTL